MDLQTMLIAAIGLLPPGVASDAILAIPVLLILSGATAQVAALFGLTKLAAVNAPLYAVLQKLAGNYGKATNAVQPAITITPAQPTNSTGVTGAILLALALGGGLSACTSDEQEIGRAHV